mmetsp:Transcript_51448/g.129917  ORF Transcript_51448/g.129917 Transcript_51448/m.129917 type:complete len:137 (+) Transcript_51448:575-985(+)
MPIVTFDSRSSDTKCGVPAWKRAYFWSCFDVANPVCTRVRRHPNSTGEIADQMRVSRVGRLLFALAGCLAIIRNPIMLAPIVSGDVAEVKKSCLGGFVGPMHTCSGDASISGGARRRVLSSCWTKASRTPMLTVAR